MKCYNKKISAIAICCLMVSGCAHPNQNTYGEADVGHDAVVMYGIVKSVRKVDIKGNNTGTGALIGAAGGGLAGSAIGHGNGSLAAAIAGIVIGGVSGAMAEQAMQDRQGIEYIIKFSETGDTRSIVQNIAKTDTPIAKGSCVMVQMNGNYQRVLLDDDMSDCPKPVKHKHTYTKTKLTQSHRSETTIEHDE